MVIDLEPSRRATSWGGLLPGLMLCVGVALAARAASWFEVRLLGHPVLDAVPLAIVFGLAIRSTLPLPASTRPGICFSSKTLLEIAVVLLGSMIDPAAVLSAGPALLLGIATVVALSIPTSYLLGRLAGLDQPLALLIAVGNSICGNSAIAALAPVIRAPARDVAASITFTAVLGIAAVLFLPFLPDLIGYSANQYGIFAGLTVYAVPQVLAATAPVSQLSLQVGTVVKLLRVLMLGPVIVAISLWFPKGSGARRSSAATMLPWFIIGFVAMLAARSAGLIPRPVQPALAAITEWLTVISMAALGLSADLRVLARVGGRVFLAATLSLAALGVFSYGLIRLLGIA